MRTIWRVILVLGSLVLVLALLLLGVYLFEYDADDALRDLNSGVPERVEKGLDFFENSSSEYTRAVGDALLPMLKRYPSHRSALSILSLARERRAVEPILARIESGDVREGPVRALGDIGDKRALGPLLRLWRGGTRDWYILKAIAKLADERAEPEMIRLSHSTDDSDRCIAAPGLGRCGTKAATKRLMEMWETEEDYVIRCDIATGLGLWGTEEAVAVLAARHKTFTKAFLTRRWTTEEFDEACSVSEALAATGRASALVAMVERFRSFSQADLKRLSYYSAAMVLVKQDLRAARDLSGDTSWAEPDRKPGGIQIVVPPNVAKRIENGLAWWDENKDRVEALAKRGELLPRAKESDSMRR